MTDWDNPATSQPHSEELAATKGRDESVATMDFSNDSNYPDGTIRWNATAQRFEIWDAGNTQWNELVSKYLINVDQLDGRDAGNGSGDIPINNGTLNTDLNADQLDGQHGSFYDDMVNGTRTVFYQNAAPTGWNQVTGANDKVIMVNDSGGGTTGGGWTITGLNVLGHQLTDDEMPSHTHGSGTLSTDSSGSHDHGGNTGGDGAHTHSSLYYDDTSNDQTLRISSPLASTRSFPGASYVQTNNQGHDVISSVGNHSHGIGFDGNHSHNVNSGSTGSAGSDNSHDHGISHDGNWRPAHADVIIAERSK